MVVEQIVDIPANHRIILDVPRTVPEGRTILTFTPASGSQTIENSPRTTRKALPIEEIRNLLQKEMTEKGTSAIHIESGDGWTAHVMETYAKS
ncbi:MAG: DUF3295 domain-containing protein [Treponema sp.]|nr:DUF3295 domain-containing protein [Treponema sp.]